MIIKKLKNIFTDKRNIQNIVLFVCLIIWALIKIVVFYASDNNKPLTFLSLFIIYFGRAFPGFFVFKLLFILYDKYLEKYSLSKFLIFILLPLSFVTSAIWVISGNIFISFFGYYKLSNLLVFLAYSTTINLLPTLALTGLYFLIKQWELTNRERENSLKAIALANEAQSMMLRYQINPHFLFNSLNTIRAVILDDKHKARKMVTELSEFFRYTLSQNINDKVELKSEIEAIKNYLEIQKIRFEENLTVDYFISEKTKEIKIPLFIIHPLVENSIKYGLQTSQMPLKIIIVTELNDKNELTINIINSGRIIHQNENISNTDGTNTGINNIINRLNICYNKNASFVLFEENNNVNAVIKIKLV